MLHRGIVVFCCDNYLKHTDTLCGDTAKVLNGSATGGCHCVFSSFEVEKEEETRV
jgi:hypothetical protein